jgi:hypothetical protein
MDFIHPSQSQVTHPTMLSTRLTTTDNGILSHEFIPDNLRSLIGRRTENNKKFGKLEILTPQIISNTETAEPRNLIAGFLLDTSASMSGTKIEHARDTIKKLVEVLHSERTGNTIEHQPFRSWIYVISFNSVAEVIIPFQEITDETLPIINGQLDTIRAYGSTNYAKAFQKQNEVIEAIIARLNNPDQESTATATATAASGRFHLIRFFETDGDITEGSSNAILLYNMMRSAKTSATATAAAQITYEDVILGYGTDVNLECLKKLASPYAPEKEYNCSSLVTIIKPEDIGWQVGEILFKLIMRYGFKVNISIAAATPGDDAATAELFEYQTHQWSSSTTLHSFIHGDNKQIWIQYTPGATAAAADAATPRVKLQIQYENQFTGETFTYQFEHEIQNVVDVEADVEDTSPPPSAAIVEKTITLLNGMAQIEIFKQFREIESTRYNKDTIVSEAYKTMRMLKTIDAMTRTGFPALSCQTLNLMTDVKVIIGLTTIESQQEQNIILHARRTCSAENEFFNTGATVSRKYVANEEDHEEEAKCVIKAAADAAAGASTDAAPALAHAAAYEEDYYVSDALPSRIASISTQLQPDDIDTPFHGGVSPHYHHYHDTGSEVRTLCAKIAIARANNEDITAEQLYEQMRTAHHHHHHHDYNDCYAPYDDDNAFSSTPMDDEYTQRRMGMMRRMS